MAPSRLRLSSNDYLLVAKCPNTRNTREILAQISKNISANTAINICTQIFRDHGIPAVVKSDNGPAFRAREFEEFLKRFNVKHQKIAPLNPAANGGVENAMKQINKVIRCAAVEKKDWKPMLKKYLELYNQTPHSATGFTPNFLARNDGKSNLIPILREKQLNDSIKAQVIINNNKAKEKKSRYISTYKSPTLL